MRYPTAFAAASCLVLWAAPSLAEDGPPRLDIESTCRSSGRAEVQVQTSQKDSEDGCLRSERAAHDEIKKRWNDYSASAKAQCSKQSQAGGFPSYVETVTCLELASGTVPSQTGNGSAATSGPGAPKAGDGGPKEGGSLTAEPSPAQRTDPIEVLDKK